MSRSEASRTRRPSHSLSTTRISAIRGAPPSRRGTSTSVSSPAAIGKPKRPPTSSSAERAKSRSAAGLTKRVTPSPSTTTMASAVRSMMRRKRPSAALKASGQAPAPPPPSSGFTCSLPPLTNPSDGSSRGSPARMPWSPRKGSPMCMPSPSMVNSRISFSWAEPRILSTAMPRRISPSIST